MKKWFLNENQSVTKEQTVILNRLLHGLTFIMVRPAATAAKIQFYNNPAYSSVLLSNGDP